MEKSEKRDGLSDGLLRVVAVEERGKSEGMDAHTEPAGSGARQVRFVRVHEKDRGYTSPDGEARTILVHCAP
jgi:hypothetical protein